MNVAIVEVLIGS